MTITPTTEMQALQPQRRAPSYFPGNDEDPQNAEPAPSADFSFSDLLDVINPLQHIPVVSSIYRAVTGDTISPTANVMGGALFGGPLGAIATAATEMFSEMTGGTPEEHLIAMIEGGSATAPAAQPDAQTAMQSSALLAQAQAPAPVQAQTQAQGQALAQTQSLAPEPAAPAMPSAFFEALQSPAGVSQAAAAHGATQRTGRGLRSYFAEAGPAVPRAGQQQVADTAPAEGGSSGGSTAATAGDAQEREAMRAAVDAVHARGLELLRQQGGVQGSAAAQDVPDWFAERMMQGLTKYRDGSQLGSAPPSSQTTSG